VKNKFHFQAKPSPYYRITLERRVNVNIFASLFNSTSLQPLSIHPIRYSLRLFYLLKTCQLDYRGVLFLLRILYKLHHCF